MTGFSHVEVAACDPTDLETVDVDALVLDERRFDNVGRLLEVYAGCRAPTVVRCSAATVAIIALALRDGDDFSLTDEPLTVLLARLWRVADRRWEGRDVLTGLYDRRYFIRQLKAGMRIQGVPVSIMLFDIDKFKTINDRYGHSSGDRVLIELAQRLSATVPPGGIVTRLHGDRFGVLLTGTRQDSMAVAQRALAAVRDTPIQDIQVTASAGLASSQENADDERLYRMADEAVYAAKSRGRPRCSLRRPSA